MKYTATALLLILCLVGGGVQAGAIESDVLFESQTVILDIADGEYPSCYAVVAITNIGDTAIDIHHTSFDLEDSEGELVATEPIVQGGKLGLLAPGETGYYFSEIYVSDSIEANKEYVLLYDPKNIVSANVEDIVDFEVAEVSFPKDGYHYIIGRVVNPTAEWVEAVDVVIICYNQDGEIVTVSGAVVEGVEANGKSTFEIRNDHALERTDITDYRIMARKIVD